MGDHFFLLMYATSGEERNVTRFTSYRRVEDAVAMVKEWLEKACCMDCYPAAEEAALREANGGQLPETALSSKMIVGCSNVTFIIGEVL